MTDLPVIHAADLTPEHERIKALERSIRSLRSVLDSYATDDGWREVWHADVYEASRRLVPDRVLHAEDLDPMVLRQVLDLLRAEKLSDACTASFELQSEEGEYQSTRVTPSTYQAICRLIQTPATV